MGKTVHARREVRPGANDSRGGFRSHGEAQIGRCLEHHGIRYFYEHPLAVLDDGKLRIWYPDFQLPFYGLVMEYGGRLDDPCYAAGWRHKRTVYEANGVGALMLTPDDLRGDWPTRLLDRIEHTLAGRLERFRRTRTEAGSGADGLGSR